MRKQWQKLAEMPKRIRERSSCWTEMTDKGQEEWNDWEKWENWKKFVKVRKGFSAFPTVKGSSLDQILAIHEKANLRSKLSGYKQIRREFIRIMKKQIVTKDISDTIINLLKNSEDDSSPNKHR